MLQSYGNLAIQPKEKYEPAFLARSKHFCLCFISTMSEEKIHRFTFCVEFIIQQERIDKPTDSFKTKQHKTTNKEYFFSL